MSTQSTNAAGGWGVSSEYGVLRDVLLCRPDYFRWLPTSSISKATLKRGPDGQGAARAVRIRTGPPLTRQLDGVAANPSSASPRLCTSSAMKT